jgi:uncharacterized protein (TIGR03437 family)
MKHILLLLWAAATLAALEVPVSFEKNQGQAPASVRYLARSHGYAMLLEDQRARLVFPNSSRQLSMSLHGARPASVITALDAQPQQTHYFIGGTARHNVANFGRIAYRHVYPGVDLVYHSTDNELEYDFILSPGADPTPIAVEFSGADSVRITPTGALALTFGDQLMTHKAPVAWQTIAGRRHNVPVQYVSRGNARIGFTLGSYDPRYPLTIDPVLIYSTFLGGNRADNITGVATDREGAVYVTGQTVSIDFPTKGTNLTPYQGALNYGFIAKFKPGGEELVYSTIIGGSSNTTPFAIAVDDDGNAYVTGMTGARNFPLVNPVQSQQPGLNIGFVLKLNPTGDKLLFSTYHGGERNDRHYGIALGRDRSIYVTGYTTSTTFPLVNAWQPQMGGSSQDAFVAKFQAPAYRLAYSSFMGGTGTEQAFGIAVDASGAAYITGDTRSPNFATPDAFNTRYRGTEDGFVAKVHPDGSGLDFFSYLGGTGDDSARAIALDAAGNIWVTGSTMSTSFPVTANALQPTINGRVDAFLSSVSNDGRQLQYATYLGGTNNSNTSYNEAGQAIAIDAEGSLWIGGVTRSADFPAVRSLQSYGGGESDAFLTRYNPTTNQIEFSTTWGGSSNDEITAMSIDALGAIYVGGETASTNFPLKAAFRSTFGPSTEAFITKLCEPRLTADLASLTFLQVQGAAAPAARPLRISACAAIPISVRLEGDFLRATPTTATTNAELSVSVDGRSLPIGDYNGKIIITSPDASNSPLTVPVTLRVNPPAPVISAAAVVNAASSKADPVAPGELIVIYGTNLGPAQLAGFSLVNNARFSTDVAATRVWFDGVPAPIVYTSSGQVSAIVPYSVSARPTASMQLEYRGALSNIISLPVAAASPALFTANASGSGPGAILNQDYSLNTAANPADKGATILLYATGEGMTTPASEDGVITGSVLARPRLAVSVTIGGQQAIVDYAGAAPGLVAGVFQLNVRVPANIASGAQPVIITVGSFSSPAGVTVNVR